MSDPILELRSVSRHYGRGASVVKAVDSADLEVLEGDFALVTGPSGSGKSTLLYLMSGMLKPSGGEVVVAGRSLRRFSERELASFRKETIGFVFQAYNLIPHLTALENVMASRLFDADKKEARARELLADMGLGQRARHLPSELSGGEQQRVAIARALLNDPAIIFADEPTGNLDTAAGENIIEILKTLHGDGKTVVLATHQPSLIGGAETLSVEMLDGRVDSAGRR